MGGSCAAPRWRPSSRANSIVEGDDSGAVEAAEAAEAAEADDAAEAAEHARVALEMERTPKRTARRTGKAKRRVAAKARGR